MAFLSHETTIHTDYSPHILVSLPRHGGVGLLRKNMIFFTALTMLRGESRRPTLQGHEHRSEYFRFVAKEANGKSGFIYLGVSNVSFFMPLSPTIMSGLIVRASRCDSFFLLAMYVTQRRFRHG